MFIGYKGISSLDLNLCKSNRIVLKDFDFEELISKEFIIMSFIVDV